MKMEVIEKKYKVTYPELFRKIYLSQDMSWMCGNSVDNYGTQFFPNQYVDPYLYWNMFNFSEVEQWYCYLLSRANESGCKVKDDFKFLPFAMEDGGDLFLFDFTINSESPILCWTKDCEIAIVNENFEQFICSHLASCVIDFSMSISHWLIGWHMRYLTKEHRQIFETGNINAIAELMQATNCYKHTDYLIY